MRVFVDFEAGHLEIGSFIDEATILCAQGDVFGHRHVESTAINEGASGLFVIYRSPTWIEEHGSASSEHEWRHVDGRHLEKWKLHNGSTSRGVNIQRYEGRAAIRQEALMISEIVVVALDSEPIPEVESVTGHHAPRVGWRVGDPVGGGLLLEKTGTLNGQLIFDFLSRG